MKIIRSLIALSMLATTAYAAPCDTLRLGQFLPGFQPNQFLVTCWPIEYNAATVYRDSQNNPLTLADFHEGDTVLVTGCPDANEFVVTAVTVEKQVPDPASMVFDEHIVLGSTGAALYVQFVSDPAICTGPVGMGNLNPPMTLQVGKRYKLSFPFVQTDSVALSGFGNGTTTFDDFLLVPGPMVGTFESDPAVNWVETGTDGYFTLTPALAAALNVNGQAGFRQVFTNTARSNATIVTPSAVEDWGAYN